MAEDGDKTLEIGSWEAGLMMRRLSIVLGWQEEVRQRIRG